jgi:hypothetical protein
MSNKRNALIQQFPDEEFLIVDGLDEAIIGIDTNSRRVIYSKRKCLEIRAAECEELADEDRSAEEIAIEDLEFNTYCTYVGAQTPIWMDDLEEE